MDYRSNTSSGNHHSFWPREKTGTDELPLIEKIKQTLKCWSSRKVGLKGKITIVKSLALSKLTYFLTLLENPSNTLLQQLNIYIFAFIWDNKPDKIMRTTLMNLPENGGLKMVNLETVSNIKNNMGKALSWPI